MSTSFEINNIALVPIKDAAKSVAYSRDYVARLAREKKIVASQIAFRQSRKSWRIPCSIKILIA